MNGKVVVMAMVVGVVGLMAAAFLWPEGKESAKPEVAEEEEDDLDEDDAPAQNFRVAERGKDGSVTITNLPEGAEDPVAAAKRRQAERRAERGEMGNPFEQFVDDGTPLTQSAMEQPTMADLDPTSDDYDASIEARQRFHGYEMDLLSKLPLDPEGWKDVTRNHQDDIKGVLMRSQQLVAAGEREKARLLMEEWGELQNKYKAQAYGRSPQPYTDE